MNIRGRLPFPTSLRGRVFALALLAFAGISLPAAAVFSWVIDTTIIKIGTLFAENQILFDRYRGLESLTREVSLAETAARSPAVIDWARNETDPDRMTRGIAELEHYRTSFRDQSYFMVVRNSGNYYFNNAADEFAGQQKRYSVSSSNPRDGWFFKTVALERGCHLNVDHDDVLQVTKVWINCVIRDGRDAIGVLGTGVDLSSFIREVVDIPQKGVQSMFVDLRGAVQAHRDPKQVDFHSITKNTKNKSTVFGLLDEERDRAELRAMMNEVAAGETQVKSAFMHLGGKKYLVGVGYLDKLGWYNVTLMDVDAIVDRSLFWPIALLLGAAILAAAMLLTVLFRRFVLDRLARLEQSVHTMEEGDFDTLKVDPSRDEIGRLSRAVGRMAEVVGEKTHVLEDMVRERTEKLERLAFLDPMTEIWNRRGFADAFNKEHGISLDNGRRLGILLVDLDHFKSINDTHGHQAGDDAIIEVANRISCSLRDFDICARWGGDEFIVLAGDVNRTSLALMASRILIAVSREPVRLSNGEILDVSVSIGGCVVAEDDVLADAATRADEALYASKRRGRNGYLIHDSKTASSEVNARRG